MPLLCMQNTPCRTLRIPRLWNFTDSSSPYSKGSDMSPYNHQSPLSRQSAKRGVDLVPPAHYIALSDDSLSYQFPTPGCISCT